MSLNILKKELWPGGLSYAGDSIGTDSLCLAAQWPPAPGSHGCDLGCGCGILMLLLLWEQPRLQMSGVELRADAAEFCRRNLAENGMADRSAVFTGDFRTVGPESGTMDFVISNPPYFPAGSGGVSPDPDRAAMRTETASLPELCAVAFRLLKNGGDFRLVHRISRREELLSALTGAGFSLESTRDIALNAETPASLFLCRAVKGAAQADAAVLPTLYQRGNDGRETEEYRKICHWEE